MTLSNLLRGASLRGDPAILDAATSTRVGRALGTLIRRRGGGGPGRATVVVARSQEALTVPVREGIVRGLVLAGHDVKDIGVVGSEVFTFALRHLQGAAGVIVTSGGDGALSLVVFHLGRPLVGEGLQALVEIADGEDFAAGEGSLELVDVTAAHRALESLPEAEADAEGDVEEPSGVRGEAELP
jgi:hypothetical protein